MTRHPIRLEELGLGHDRFHTATLYEKRAWITLVNVTVRATDSRALLVVVNPEAPAEHRDRVVAAARFLSTVRVDTIARCIDLEPGPPTYCVLDCDPVTSLMSLATRWHSRTGVGLLDPNDTYTFVESSVLAVRASHDEGGLGGTGIVATGFGSFGLSNIGIEETGQLKFLGVGELMAGPVDEEARLGIARWPGGLLGAAKNPVGDAHAAMLAVRSTPALVSPHPAVLRVLSGQTLPGDEEVDQCYAALGRGLFGSGRERFTSLDEVASIYRRLYELLDVQIDPPRLYRNLARQYATLRAEGYFGSPLHPADGLTGRDPVTDIAISDGVIDVKRGEVRREQGTWPLTKLEGQLLRYLVDHAGQNVPVAALLRDVWGSAPGLETRAVADCVKRLRRKLERDPMQPRHLRTARGIGYRFEP